MRLILLTTSIVLGFVSAASSQPGSRFELSPVVRLDRVFLEGDARGDTVAAGAAAFIRVSNHYGVEAELTKASNRIGRTYEGTFISYVPGAPGDPIPAREEFDRWAPIARRALGYAPGIGGSAAFVARSEISPRVTLAARAGLSGRRYVETSTYTILTVPAGVDPSLVARDFRDASVGRTRGGLLFGVDVSVALTRHLSVAPELRFVYGGPARVGNKHREFGLGARGAWQF